MLLFAAIKDHDSGEFLLNGDDKHGPAAEIIIHGTKFNYKSKGSEALTAEGPLLAPVEIMVSGHALNYKVSFWIFVLHFACFTN